MTVTVSEDGVARWGWGLVLAPRDSKSVEETGRHPQSVQWRTRRREAQRAFPGGIKAGFPKMAALEDGKEPLGGEG